MEIFSDLISTCYDDKIDTTPVSQLLKLQLVDMLSTNKH